MSDECWLTRGEFEESLDIATNAVGDEQMDAMAMLVGQDSAQRKLRLLSEILVRKLDIVIPDINDRYAFCANHGFTYDGPQFGEELDALREALGIEKP